MRDTLSPEMDTPGSGPQQSRYDVVVVGGGHNGLVAAAYLAGAGLSVLVLERLGTTGGAVVSQEIFPGMPARVSRYGDLVSLFPDQIVNDLGLELQFRSRRTTSYTPVIRGGRPGGLLVEGNPTHLTADSFRVLTGSEREYEAWQSFHGRVAQFAQVVAPSMLEPLVSAKTMRDRVAHETWAALVEQPLTTAVEREFTDDIVRGVIASGALVGTFTDLHSPDLDQNRSFLYHVLGNGTGEWKVPIGGMGGVAAALERAVWRNNGEVLTRAFVTGVQTDGVAARVNFQAGGTELSVECSWVLGNVAPWVMKILLGEQPGPRPEGSGIKINMLLDRLPRLRSGISPPMAFAGTMHFAESYEQLQQSFLEAQEGFIPETPPGALFCHTLTDPSVLGALAMDGKHVFTFFGINTPARLYSGHVETQRDETVLRILDVMNTHFEEPIENLVSLDQDGNPCLEAKAPQDIETALAMPGGHIYHGPLSWPWVEDEAQLDTPARRWGVGTNLPNVLVCGAGARRGGEGSGARGGKTAGGAPRGPRQGPPAGG